MNIQPDWWKRMLGARNRIAEVRKSKKLTQGQLAEKVDVHVSTISRLENGGIDLTQEYIELIAAALEVEPMALLFDLSVLAQTPEEKSWLELGRTLDPEMRELVQQLIKAKSK
ncbi:MAG TPA: helix-turn-helix transcriptional regulator [Geminicoccus sp.]|uniref:helix-turn-helix domain-containing protein n=1 Tax=Geminicoccus sp. TaxID=2024832 RepID=UPI002BFFE878|nr:helix-turn-helix transcriptional regulator [Geminicoccus sp.]HWL72131.1 helix-turn-helix transcriptional regulator [Geminicoccus sp.]